MNGENNIEEKLPDGYEVILNNKTLLNNDEIIVWTGFMTSNRLITEFKTKNYKYKWARHTELTLEVAADYKAWHIYKRERINVDMYTVEAQVLVTREIEAHTQEEAEAEMLGHLGTLDTVLDIDWTIMAHKKEGA